MSPTKDLADLTERFLSVGHAQSPQVFAALMKGFQATMSAGCYADTAFFLRRIALPTLDYTSAQALSRVRSRLRSKIPASPQTARLAVIGSSTTTQLVPLIDFFLFAAGVDADFYEGGYGLFRQEILDPASELYQFAPKVIFLATGWRDLANRPALADARLDIVRLITAEQADWSSLWQVARERSGCQIIQNNFVLPACRALANHERRQAGSLSSYISSINESLAQAVPPFVTIHDVEHLATCWGRWKWDDPRFVHQAKLPCAPECLPDYAHSVASIVAAQLGLAKKCLVLDLDNTLWGGVVGDDGLGGIRLGQTDPEGEAYRAFQHYAKSLRHRGVLLAVCSKNNEETAREVFEKHSEMVLRLEDIACFKANWEDKATNLCRIAQELNIGTNSLVFVDDSPAERALVRKLLPEVAVPELPTDVADYIQALDRHRYFQTLSVETEDLRRTEYYRAEVSRRDAQTSASDIEGFLASLNMVAQIGPIMPDTLNRSVQLIQRSNQFNLTTRRRTAAELLAFLEDESWITRTVSLSDRFGDNGIISVILARAREDALEIDTWVMSCRVLKRTVEQFVLNHLYGLARQRGLKRIRGEFIPTAKNKLVRDHYANLGFAPVAGAQGERTLWDLTVADDSLQTTTYIREETNA
ncbi:MAG TPA: HAD-IIIC family phosphatase [Verrucomicrobiota bacterium]|jgi:FkbH-like protein|nr:HAD-IIIC family phosphatase [Verrucomicrobiota bacterium]HQL78604.1 HAD-IIIC family phosphatase [Verrucomicrobiota bacterium]